MKPYTSIIIGMMMAMSSQSVLAQHADMNHSDMQHESMEHHDHSSHAHDHAGMSEDTLESEVAAPGSAVIIAKVNGLVCDFCAQALKKVFKKEETVEALNVDLDKGEVHIALQPGQTLSDDVVKKLIRKSGYSLVSLTHSKSDSYAAD